ncbi:ABC transporter substrate-binding protein [Streptomyces sp. NPDC051776]|uniref:ABC transporter substrate-binding protein n=1 Tax=Streptomyces sp. NPDC051776 TaxID=3155414 RepID=UPI00342AF62D
MHTWQASARAAAVTTVFCATLALGCGSDDDESTNSASFTGRGPIVLAMGKDNSGVVSEILDQWNRKHPEERVRGIELSDSPDEQRRRMIQDARLESGEFTVLSLDVVWTSEFAANRWVSPLPRDRVNTSGMLRPTVEGASYRGSLIAMPWTTDAGLLYYRTDLLEKVGAKPPRTWTEMEQICAKVLALPEARGMSCYAGQFDKYEGLTVNFAEMVDSSKGTVVDENGKPHVDSPEAAKGLEFFTRAFADGLIPKKAITFKEEEGRQAFQNGELVFLRQWPYQWTLSNKRDGSSEVAGKFNVAPLPGLDGPGVSSLGGHNLAVSASAKNKATALDFISYATSERTQRENLLRSSNAPTDASLYEEPDLIAKYPYLPVLKESILHSVPRPRLVRYGDATAAIQAYAYRALNSQQDPEDALRDMQHDLSQLR